MQMRSADAFLARWRTLLLASLFGLIAGCGGGTTTTTTTICNDPSICVAELAQQTLPPLTDPNVTEIVVDGGPPGGFVLGVTNVPYVTVTVCSPGSATSCVTVDHVLLDTGSYGLRLLKSKVGALGLPAVAVAANAGNGTPAGNAAECYPFVLGAVWGPLAKADVRVASELAPAQTIQLIDDSSPTAPTPPPDCTAAAGPGGLLSSVASLQANGILGIGMVDVDCGTTCETNAYPNMHVVYYSCPAGGAACMPAAIPMASQVQNPVAGFVADSNGKFNNNGTMITMPTLPKLGAKVAKGRLVFGIGTQANNQMPSSSQIYPVETNSASANYLYVDVKVGTQSYPQSYIDTGSNAMFFDNATLQARACSTAQGGWYCPAATWSQSATMTGSNGAQGMFTLTIESADALFNVNAVAFANLGGTAGQGTSTFTLGMPFFFGRQVYTSIWGQSLSLNGPWYAF
jgi:hypothetical protein